MIKKLELIGDSVLDTCEEYKTEINGKKVTSIDTSCFVRERRIVLKDENRRTICELYVPESILVKVSYIE